MSQLARSSSATGGYTRQLHNFIQSSKGAHSLTWEESVSGADHNIVWFVTAKVDGQQVGSASGSRKNVAKDHASREALVTLGIISH